MRQIGLDYGAAFRVINAIWQGEKEAHLHVTLAPEVTFEQKDFLHPTLVDACFQGVACAAGYEERNDMYLPASIGQVDFLTDKKMIRSAWGHIRLTSTDEATMKSDIDITDEEGQVICTITDFEVRKVQRSEIPQNNEQPYYTLVWEKKKRQLTYNEGNKQHANDDIDRIHAPCLIFADKKGFAERVAEQIPASTTLVYSGKTFEQKGERHYCINPDRKEDLITLFHHLYPQGLTDEQALRVLYCWNLDIAGIGDEKSRIGERELDFTPLDFYNHLLYVVQTLSQSSQSPFRIPLSKLWVVTHNVHTVDNQHSEQPLSVFQSPVWGFGRTVSIAHPDIWGGLIDVNVDDGHMAEADHRSLYKQIVQDIYDDLSSENQILYHSQRDRYVARLTKKTPSAQVQKDKALSPHHAYLITGGLGHLGLTFAHWIADRGATQIVLLSRRALPPRETWEDITDPEEQQILTSIKALEQRGVDVVHRSVDVSDQHQVDQFFDQLKQQNIRDIKGVIHAAGTVYNQAIEDIQPADLNKIMEPKVNGALYLHQHFLHDQLDFFILFSSMTSLLSPPRLAVYAAANAFLDALAHERQRLGLQATSINWGPWAEAGMATDDQTDREHTAGIRNMSVDEGLQYFNDIWQDALPQIAVAKVHWPDIQDMFPSITNTSFLTQLTSTTPRQGMDDHKDTQDVFLTQLSENPHEQSHLIKAFLRQTLARVLKIDQDMVEDDASLNALGLDSMMAIELTNSIELETNVNIPMSVFLQGATLNSLADHMASALDHSVESEPHLDSSAGFDQTQGRAEHGGDRSGVASKTDASMPTKMSPVKEGPAKEEKAAHPLSHGQRSLWFLQQLQPHNTAYNVGFAVKVLSGLDITILKETLSMLVKKHEALRTKIVVQQDDEPYQVFQSEADYAFIQRQVEYTDESKLKQEIFNAIHTPFNFDRDPMMRVYLFDRHDTSILMFVIHHMAIDYWGIEVLLQDFKLIYEQLSQGQTYHFAKADHHYADFVQWQHDYAHNSEGQKALQYWRTQLESHVNHVLDLPTAEGVETQNQSQSQSQSQSQTYTGDSVILELDEALVQRIKAYARDEETTLFVPLLAMYQLLLHRYSGQDEVIVGTPTSGRHQARFRDIVGDFINMLPIVSTVGDNPTLAAYIQQLKNTVLEALEHQAYPFPLLVEDLQPHRLSSRSPIFQASFILQSMNQLSDLSHFMFPSEKGAAIDFGGLTIQPYHIQQQEGQLDLTLELIETDGKVMGAFKYNTQLFKRASMKQMAQHYHALLNQLVTNPSLTVKGVPLLTDDEREQRWNQWDTKRSALPEEQHLYQVIDNIAQKYPDHTALSFEGDQLTYNDLLTKVEVLAQGLKAHGVQKGDRVGIYIDRRVEMVIALLAAVKMGAVYVPLDPSFPQERIHFMVADAGINMILIHRDRPLQKAREEERVQYNCLPVDQILEGELEGDECESNFVSTTAESTTACEDVPIKPHDSMYIIYTSGSTGQPKGVEVQHQAVLNFLLAMAKEPGINEDDRLLAVTTLSFDISILEIFLPLTVGAETRILSRTDAMDGRQLQKAISKYKPTVMQATPATWKMLIDSGWQGDANLDVLCGGEALPLELATVLKQKCKRLWNLYGPTEATIWMATKEVQPTTDQITIGQPIQNMEMYVLDEYLNHLPIGVPGELYLAGVGLAKGYLNRPSLTEERFISVNIRDTEGGTSNKRLYRTGDLVRKLPHGEIEHLGRIDDQVKVNGYRIELGEIESHLNQLPSIQQAIVIPDREGHETHLVAYIKPTSETSLEADSLRQYLAEKLPYYMIPATFTEIDHVPLTPNGKVDRKKLPMISAVKLQASAPYAAPQTALQREMTTIWAEVLGVDKVSVHDSFFELGGTSLLATKVQRILTAKQGIELSVVDLFNYPTVKSLSEYLTRQKGVQGNGQHKEDDTRLVNQSSEVIREKDQQNRISHLEKGKRRLNQLRDYRKKVKHVGGQRDRQDQQNQQNQQSQQSQHN